MYYASFQHDKILKTSDNFKNIENYHYNYSIYIKISQSVILSLKTLLVILLCST